jgi:hypothetical protein
MVAVDSPYVIEIPTPTGPAGWLARIGMLPWATLDLPARHNQIFTSPLARCAVAEGLKEVPRTG